MVRIRMVERLCRAAPRTPRPYHHRGHPAIVPTSAASGRDTCAALAALARAGVSSARARPPSPDPRQRPPAPRIQLQGPRDRRAWAAGRRGELPFWHDTIGARPVGDFIVASGARHLPTYPALHGRHSEEPAGYLRRGFVFSASRGSST